VPEDAGQHADGQSEDDGLDDRVAGGMNPADSEVEPFQLPSRAFSPIVAAGSARAVSAI
jgi:hypothetical protein